jgi:hypothetical protein
MAILKEDLQFSHVIAIDFGTGASGYGIAPRLSGNHGDNAPRIEVLNPCDDGDDQKTPTTILFSNEGEFIAFGKDAL